MITAVQLQHIKKSAIQIDWHEAFAGKTKGNRHLFRAVKIAQHLCLAENGRLDIVLASAWLHDIGLAFSTKLEHIELGISRARQLMDEVNIDQDDQNKVCQCIVSHEGTNGFPSLESKIVHDADVIDKSAVLGIIRHSWKLLHQPNGRQWTTNTLTQELQQHLSWRQHHLQTDTAISLHQHIQLTFNAAFSNQQDWLQVVKRIMPLIKQDMISDKIASDLLIDPSIPSDIKRLITIQLACRFPKASVLADATVKEMLK